MLLLWVLSQTFAIALLSDCLRMTCHSLCHALIFFLDQHRRISLIRRRDTRTRRQGTKTLGSHPDYAGTQSENLEKPSQKSTSWQDTHQNMAIYICYKQNIEICLEQSTLDHIVTANSITIDILWLVINITQSSIRDTSAPIADHQKHMISLLVVR